MFQDNSPAEVTISCNSPNGEEKENESGARTAVISFRRSTHFRLSQLLTETIDSCGFSAVEGTFVIKKHNEQLYNENDLQKLADAVWTVSQHEGLELTTRVVCTASTNDTHCNDVVDDIVAGTESIAGASNPNEDSTELSISKAKKQVVNLPSVEYVASRRNKQSGDGMNIDIDDDVENQTIRIEASNCSLAEDISDDYVAKCEPTQLMRVNARLTRVNAPGAISITNGSTVILSPAPLTLSDEDEDSNEHVLPISAVAVDHVQMEREMEKQVRRQISREAQMASIVIEEEKGPKSKATKLAAKIFSLIAIVAIAATAIARLVVQDSENRNGDDGYFKVPPALATVLENGLVRCGLSQKDGFGYVNATTGRHDGFEVDLCQAMAAMVLQDPDKVETTFIPNPERFDALWNGTVDLLTFTTTHTMSRDIHQLATNAGYTFSTPYLYDGVAFAGNPSFLQCADAREVQSETCSGLRICVTAGTTEYDVVSDQLPAANLYVTTSETLFDSLIDGHCNVICGEGSKISESILRKAGYTGPYHFGTDLVSRDPLAMVSRQDDPKWSLLVDTIIQALLTAEQAEITQEDAIKLLESKMSLTQLDEESFEMRLLRVVAAVGNYGEMYRRHLESVFPRAGQNVLNDGSGGLILSHPFGNSGNEGPGPIEGGVMEKILDRGYLICGIRPERPGFAIADTKSFDDEGGQWTGLDVDYCRAISSALFGGDFSSLVFVELEDGYSFQTDIVSTTVEVDVVAGAIRDYDLLTSNTYSQPYYYYTDNDDDSTPLSTTLSLMTTSNDPQWSDFVYWVVSSTFFAEEQQIQRFNANRMPEVQLYGPTLTRMFRDAILAVGNYGELYYRNVEDLQPRQGTRNILNSMPFGAQHFPLYKTNVHV